MGQGRHTLRSISDPAYPQIYSENHTPNIQNRQSFAEDITKNTFVSYLSKHTVYAICETSLAFVSWNHFWSNGWLMLRSTRSEMFTAPFVSAPIFCDLTN